MRHDVDSLESKRVEFVNGVQHALLHGAIASDVWHRAFMGVGDFSFMRLMLYPPRTGAAGIRRTGGNEG